MKNKINFLSLIVMLGLPWIAVCFVKGDAGMVVCLLLFFSINPFYSVFVGIFAGRNIKSRWSLPVLSAILSLLGNWIFFDRGETVFIFYAGSYLVLGMIAMSISAWVKKIKSRKIQS